jgi:hypothetical protein
MSFLKSYKTPEEAAAIIGKISTERLLELANSGYAPHHTIDGKGPFFRMEELKKWIKDNLFCVKRGMPIPTRLS